MKASYRWLCSLVPELSLSPGEVADRLTGAGLEVEAQTAFGAASRDVRIVEVVSTEPHPKKERLKLVTVETGSGPARVVCGAPNVPAPGGRVVLATSGTHLPALGLTLEPRDIGGVPSAGMLCSERELGLATPAADADPGILVLPQDAGRVGDTLAEARPESWDVVFDIGLTPNRPDGLGHIGLARELAALCGLRFAPPPPPALARTTDETLASVVSIEIEDTERCPHYGGALVTDVAVGESPTWLRYRLESLGIRSISNVVDVTNHVMLEFGHPIHAFDLAFLRGGRVVVRRAKAAEVLVTLDGEKRSLSDDDLVIADGAMPVALAGVMGGAGSEIRDTTSRVLIECAYFTPRGVRRASRRHGLHTESSHRFERGVDPGDIQAVLRRTQAMLVELAGGRAAPDTLIAGVPLARRSPVKLRHRRMVSLLGLDVTLDEATATLGRLGCEIVSTSADAGEPAIEVVPPTHRPDLAIEADLIEEVVRVRGIDTIPTVLPAIRPQAPRTGDTMRQRVRATALSVGLSETVTFGFVSPRDLAALGAPEASVVLKNPLTEERSVMRTSLLPGLLEAAGRARRHGVADVRLFTIGARFLTPAEGGEVELPREASSFAAVLGGTREARLAKREEVDIYDAKGVAVEIVERALRRPAAVAHQDEATRAPHLHPRGACALTVDGTVVGHFGALHPKVARALDLPGGMMVVELDLNVMSELGQAVPRFVPIPVLPASTRDLAVVVHDDISAGAVEDAIREAAAELCESVELFDLFRGGSMPEDQRSLAFHVVYRDPLASTDPDRARTLTDKEVDERHGAVVKAVADRFGATLRA